MQVDHFKCESDDPLDDSPEGSLIWQFGAKGGRGLAYDDLAVVEFCAQRRTGVTREGYLVCVWSHRIRPRSLLIRRANAAPKRVADEIAAGPRHEPRIFAFWVWNWRR